MSNPPTASLVLTIGHSTREIEGFLDLLTEHGVSLVFDIRTIPKSRRNPQYAGDALEASLNSCGIGYEHLALLGGLRRPRPDSPNGGWRNESFRGYADYMGTPEFAAGLQRVLTTVGARETPALMCAEAVPWRCHRSLVADALLIRGVRVEHIIGHGRRRPHTLTSFAHVKGDEIIYPPYEEVDESPEHD